MADLTSSPLEVKLTTCRPCDTQKLLDALGLGGLQHITHLKFEVSPQNIAAIEVSAYVSADAVAKLHDAFNPEDLSLVDAITIMRTY